MNTFNELKNIEGFTELKEEIYINVALLSPYINNYNLNASSLEISNRLEFIDLCVCEFLENKMKDKFIYYRKKILEKVINEIEAKCEFMKINFEVFCENNKKLKSQINELKGIKNYTTGYEDDIDYDYDYDVYSAENFMIDNGYDPEYDSIDDMYGFE